MEQQEDLRVSVAGVLVELIFINVVQLWASERRGKRGNFRALVCENAREDVGELLDGGLHCEASQIVRIQQTSAVENSVRQISNVNACKRVDLRNVSRCCLTGTTNRTTYRAGVATNAEELRVLRGHLEVVECEVRDGVLVENVTLVPVVRDALVAFIVTEMAVLTLHRKERLEHFAVQFALRVLLRLVRHEAVDKCKRSGLHQNTREGSVEEVGVGVDALLESDGTDIGERL
jgi:hypothetical protein